MRNRLIVSMALIGAIAMPSSAPAHHAFAAVFDPDRPLDITGTVTKVEWMNPHIWFYVDIETADGSVENWAFEMGSPNSLVRRGWRHDSLKVGETVTVAGWHARDGTLRGAVGSIVLASGERLFGGQNTSR